MDLSLLLQFQENKNSKANDNFAVENSIVSPYTLKNAVFKVTDIICLPGEDTSRIGWEGAEEGYGNVRYTKRGARGHWPKG